MKADILAAQGRKAVDAKAVTRRGQRLGDEQQRIADDIDDTV